MKKLLLAAALAVLTAGPAQAHDAPIAHYHAGQQQPFVGLLCKSRAAAMHIFNTWMETGADAAGAVFQDYSDVRECKFLNGYTGFFRDRISGGVAFDMRGREQNVVVFSISPSEASDIVNYVVVWENTGQGV